MKLWYDVSDSDVDKLFVFIFFNLLHSRNLKSFSSRRARNFEFTQRILLLSP